jgi:signal transduction histidine kinase
MDRKPFDPYSGREPLDSLFGAEAGVRPDIGNVRPRNSEGSQTPTMADVIAHDFNNLMQVVISALRIVERRTEALGTGELIYITRSALQAADKAAAMTHRLLSIAQSPQPDPKTTQVNSVLLTLRDLLRTILGDSIDMELALCDEAFSVVCDGEQLEHTIINLVANARDAMPKGGRLKIETYGAKLELDQDGLSRGRYLGLSVCDTGCGMAPEVVHQAFDPFFTTKPVGQGSGLGLHSVRTFVEQHEGYISIDSSPGRGTSIRIYLPAESAGI